MSRSLPLLRRVLQRVLPFETTLRILSAGFLAPDRIGLHAPIHHRVRFLRRFVRPGDVCIDVGANLGYFTVPLSRLVGDRGRVYAVEPVDSFSRVLRSNVRRFGVAERVTVLPVALGSEEGATVQLATAEVRGVTRHGMTRVIPVGERNTSALIHDAPMRRPELLFEHLDRLDFLKVDIEGFETEVMPLFVPLIEQHRPVLEIEAGSPESMAMLRGLFEPIGYTACTLHENGLVPLDQAARHGTQVDAEVYFWPSGRRS